MSKHTPGPWKSDVPVQLSVASLRGLGPVMRVSTAEDLTVAYVTAGADRSIRQAISNAYLIAIAPELAELARRVAEHFENTDAPLGQDARTLLAQIDA